MNISEIMTEHVISINEDEPVIAAARLMKQHNIGSLPVRDGKNKLKGIVTDRDIVLRCVAGNINPQEVRIGEVMSRSIITARPSKTRKKLRNAWEQARYAGFRSLKTEYWSELSHSETLQKKMNLRWRPLKP